MITPDELIQEANKLANPEPTIKDSGYILESLLAKLRPVNFKALAFEKAEEMLKRKQVLTIETTLPDGTVDDSKSAELEEIKQITNELESKKLNQKQLLRLVNEELLRVARANGWNLAYRAGKIFVYNCEQWIDNIDREGFVSYLGKAAERMGVSKDDARYFEFQEKLIKQFESVAYRPEASLPDDTVLINLRNGTLEITPEGYELREFRADDFLTHQLPFIYDPDAKAPLFERFLKVSLPDEESQRVLAEFMGYIFTRNLKLEMILFLYGTGRNGKSVVFEIIRALLGTGNMSFYGLQSSTDDKGYHRAMLMNKLVNWASDVGDRLQSNTFKQLASGEPIECRLPHQQPFIMHNVCKFVFNTNTLPIDVEHTNAFFERFLIIPFTQYIKPGDRDPKLAQKIIQSELPGVLNWVLAGLDRLQDQQGFSECEASENILKKFRRESDSVALFIGEMNYQDTSESNDWTQAKPIYDDYRNFCYAEGLKPVSRQNFHNRVEALGFTLKTKNVGKVIYMRKFQSNGVQV